MIELTMERAKELLAEAVAERGADYVYVNRVGIQADGGAEVPCHYVHDDQPGCIVGFVLHRAGASLDALRAYEGLDAEDPVRSLTDAGEDVIRLLSEVQDRQDKGILWGPAVALSLAEEESTDQPDG